MEGIDLNQPIRYRSSSFRFFAPMEYHVTRRCPDDVLLLVFEGVLRFSEDGKHYEVRPGEYFIQKRDGYQMAPLPSEGTKYLYVHFHADWTDGGVSLPRQGNFSASDLMPLMEQMDRVAHRGDPYPVQAGVFFRILTELHRFNLPARMEKAETVARYIRENASRTVTLEELSERFRYSKNQIINILRAAYGKTPVEYLNQIRIQRAEWEMKVTSKSLSQIASECGYADYSQFYKVFVRIHSISPEQWRKTHRE